MVKLHRVITDVLEIGEVEVEIAFRADFLLINGHFLSFYFEKNDVKLTRILFCVLKLYYNTLIWILEISIFGDFEG